MSQRKKLTPNLDKNSTMILNLTVLQRMDPFIKQIMYTATHVSFYEFNIETCKWSRKNIEGPLFVVKRIAEPQFQFIVMNRRNADNFVENLFDFEYELQKPYLLYQNASREVNGIWFYNPDECEEVANLFNKILNPYTKASLEEKVPSDKSKFEELEPVSNSMENSRESSSATPSATDATEHSALVDFLSTSKVTGNYAADAENPRKPCYSATVTSTIASGSLSPAPAVQMPSISRSSLSIPAFLNVSSDAMNSSNQVTNLVKPLNFFPFPPSSLPLMPPISSSVPSSAALHHSPSLPCLHDAPMPQPFPPPNPLPPLRPSSAFTLNRPVMSRGRVHDALLSLAKDEQFIDMVFQALVKL